MTRSRADRLLSTANSVDIILFVDGHPGCMKSDIYRNITRNARTPEMFDSFADAGILEMTDIGNRTFLTLTDRGRRIASILRELSEELASDGRL